MFIGNLFYNPSFWSQINYQLEEIVFYYGIVTKDSILIIISFILEKYFARELYYNLE